ncbi:MAG: cupin domain-containing protein [Rhodocyclaceae bacterium]|nr:cupin domain-containing protein [Rhodocyclaceae bacterium]
MSKSNPLDPDDRDETVERALSEALTPIPLAPSRGTPLRGRLLARAAAARVAGEGFIRVPLSEADWQRMLPGVRVHRIDPQQRAVMIELAPGASLPFHRHHENEECVVLRGDVRLGEIVVRPGDYHLAPADSRHGRVTSREGALFYLRGTPIGHPAEALRDLVSALVPGEGEPALTIRADDDGWQSRTTGVDARPLYHGADGHSEMLRIAPGTRLSGPLPLLGDECLLVQGDLGIDDWAMQPGDYQRSVGHDAGHSELASRDGALLFVRAGA